MAPHNLEKPPAKRAAFSLSQHVTVGNLINLGAIVLIGTGFYWKTNLKLEEHDLKIAAVSAKSEARDQETSQFRERLFSEMQRRYDRDAATDMKIIERLTAVEVEIKGLRTDINRLDGLKK